MPSETVLVTGSSGLIGRALIDRMGIADIRRFDIRESDPAARADLRDDDAVRRAIIGVSGVVHLGGVSRVVWGERDPRLCWAVNVETTRELLRIALAQAEPPWVIYASSREVYGEQPQLPVAETARLAPVNTYARSKLAAEQLVWEAREAGLRAAVVRFSNVYGDIRDHRDRVIPAFASTAALGGTIRLDGAECCFDFTHVDDVVTGVLAIARQLAAGERALPPVHLVTGNGTTLRELSELTRSAARHAVEVTIAPPRSFDVSRFIGDPSRAAALLGWRPSVALKDGLERLVANFASSSAAASCRGAVRT